MEIKAWERVGSCVQCGECCKGTEMMCGYMVKSNKAECEYLAKRAGKFICLITDGIYNLETPTKPAQIPQEAYDYWLAECYPYPNPDDEAHTPPIYQLPNTCGFIMAVVPD